MDDAISLDIDDNGEVNIKERENVTLSECFGGVMCEYLKIKKYIDGDNYPLECQRMWCTHTDRSVIEIFYDSADARCPLNHWVKAAVPRYYEPVATPSPEAK
jgi:hypothetical protein